MRHAYVRWWIYQKNCDIAFHSIIIEPDGTRMHTAGMGKRKGEVKFARWLFNNLKTETPNE